MFAKKQTIINHIQLAELLTATGSLLSFLIAFGNLTKTSFTSLASVSTLILAILGGCFWYVFTEVILVKADFKNILQLLVIQLFSFLLTILISWYGRHYAELKNVSYSRYCCYISILIASFLSIVRILNYIFLNKRYLQLQAVKSKIKRRLLLAAPVLIIACISICIMLPGMLNEVSGDAGLNYRFYQIDRDVISLTSFDTMDAYTHLGYAYSIIILSLKNITNNAAVAAHISNIILYTLGILAFYGNIRLLVPGKKNITYLIATLIWSGGAFNLGLLDDTTWDYWMAPLMMIIIYFSLRQMVLLELFTGMIFVFTKEPAIIIFASWTIGLICRDYIILKKREISNIQILFKIASKSLYWMTLFIGLSWLWLYNNYSRWTYVTSDSYAFNLKYTLNKIATLRVINYTWVLSILMIVYLIYCFIKRKSLKNWIWPLILSDVSFLIFSCIFQTVNNPRYIDSAICVPYLMSCLLLISISKDIKSCICTVAVAILMIIATFTTTDPISLSIYPDANIGTGKLLQVGYGLHEGVTYNAQHLGYENSMNKAIKDSVLTGTQIFVPLIYNNVWNFNGLGIWEESDNYSITTEYWNTKYDRRYSFSDESLLMQEFNVYSISENTDISLLMNTSKACYIYMDAYGSDIADWIYKHYNVIAEDLFSSFGWTLHRITFVV